MTILSFHPVYIRVNQKYFIISQAFTLKLISYQQLKSISNTIMEKLGQMAQRTRKLMMMLKALHLRDDIYRLYVSRKKGRREITFDEDCINASIEGLEKFIKKSKERLINSQ